jgi:hypothetical protein
VTANKGRHDLHPSLRRRVGNLVEASLLLGTFTAIWISVGRIVIAAVLG